MAGLTRSFTLLRGHTTSIAMDAMASALTARQPMQDMPLSVPAAGLDRAAIQAAWCALQQACAAAACSGQDDAAAAAEAPMLWLHALMGAQSASDRLLADLHVVDASLRFFQVGGTGARRAQGRGLWRHT